MSRFFILLKPGRWIEKTGTDIDSDEAVLKYSQITSIEANQSLTSVVRRIIRFVCRDASVLNPGLVLKWEFEWPG